MIFDVGLLELMGGGSIDRPSIKNLRKFPGLVCIWMNVSLCKLRCCTLGKEADFFF